MATHSSVLAWKTPWMEEPGRLQPMGSQRVGHDWGTSLSLSTLMHWRRQWQPTPVFLPGESQGQGSLVGCDLRRCTVRHDWSDSAAVRWTSFCFQRNLTLFPSNKYFIWEKAYIHFSRNKAHEGTEWKQITWEKHVYDLVLLFIFVWMHPVLTICTCLSRIMMPQAWNTLN